MVCLDVQTVTEYFGRCKEGSERHPTATVFAGNVVTGEMVEEPILTGADAVKLALGPIRLHHARQTGWIPQLWGH